MRDPLANLIIHRSGLGELILRTSGMQLQLVDAAVPGYVRGCQSHLLLDAILVPDKNSLMIPGLLAFAFFYFPLIFARLILLYYLLFPYS